MEIESILKVKGRQVETIEPGASVVMAVHKLATMGIGALVVSEDGERVDGLLAERNLVRGLAKHGARLLDMRVHEIMSKGVPVCSSHDNITGAMAEMTQSRNRHLPVVDDGKLRGLISVGDVVKHRLDEIELEARVLRDAYNAGR